jgi:acetyl esterase
MALHPQVAAFLAGLPAADTRPVSEISVAEVRQQFNDMVNARHDDPIPVGSIETLQIPGPAGDIAVRLYRPAENGEIETDLPPLLVYYHGGGHVVGSLDSHDSVARGLCREARCVVASVDYRLAPEHLFPAAIDDSYAATKWLAEHTDQIGARSGSLAVAGDSAGGNIAAVVSLIARDDRTGPSIDFQLLMYPVADYTCTADSHRTYATGFGGLTADRMLWFQQQYLPDVAAADDWRASPIKGSDLSALPPALVITAECDVLHDEGVAYARAMSDAETTDEHIDWPGMIHGFVSSAAIFDEGRAALSLAAERLQNALNG